MRPPEDVAASGLYYAQRHLDAVVNPLLYHLRVPQFLGHKRRAQIVQSVMLQPASPEAL